MPSHAQKARLLIVSATGLSRLCAIPHRASLQVRLEEVRNLVKRNHIQPVVQVDVIGSRNNQQLLVVTLQLLEGIFTEVARMGFLSVNHEHGTTYLIAIRQDGHVHERQGGSLVPPVVGVQRTLVIAARGLVISVIVFHKLGSIVGKRVHHPTGQRIRTLAVVFRTLGVELLAKLIACVSIHSIEIAVGIHPAHVVHRSGDGSLDARIDGRRIQCHASPSADAQYADTVGIHLLAGRKEVHRRTEVLRVDVRRRHIAGVRPHSHRCTRGRRQ